MNRNLCIQFHHSVSGIYFHFGTVFLFIAVIHIHLHFINEQLRSPFRVEDRILGEKKKNMLRPVHLQSLVRCLSKLSPGLHFPRTPSQEVMRFLLAVQFLKQSCSFQISLSSLFEYLNANRTLKTYQLFVQLFLHESFITFSPTYCSHQLSSLLEVWASCQILCSRWKSHLDLNHKVSVYLRMVR